MDSVHLWHEGSKQGNIYPGADRSKFLTLFGPKRCNAVWNLTPPPAHHPWSLGGGFVIDHKSYKRIDLSQLVQEYSIFSDSQFSDAFPWIYLY